jgi:hypothetical protein
MRTRPEIVSTVAGRAVPPGVLVAPEVLVAVWFTVRLEDRPGSLARLAAALAARQVNITGIVGVAEDTDGTLMLTTSDAAVAEEVLTASGIDFEAHDSAALGDAGGPSAVRQGLADQGFRIEG